MMIRPYEGIMVYVPGGFDNLMRHMAGSVPMPLAE